MVIKFDINENQCKLTIEKFPNAFINSSSETVNLDENDKSCKDILDKLFNDLEYSDQEKDKAKLEYKNLLKFVFNIEDDDNTSEEQLILEDNKEKNDDVES